MKVPVKTFLSTVFQVTLLLLAMATAVAAAPQYMRIGTFTIDNGPPPADTFPNNWGASSGTGFFQGAQTWSPQAGGPNPSRVVNLTNNSVTLTSLANNKELADFLYVMAHGNERIMAVWKPNNASGYDLWKPNHMKFGENNGNIRWVLLESCMVLHYNGSTPNNPSAFFPDWTPAFNGVQSVLGYESSTFLGTHSANKNKKLWERWANPTTPGGLWNSHAYSNEWAYTYAGLLGVRPALIGAFKSGGGEFGRVHTYAQSTLERGLGPAYLVWITYGTPQY